jgi:hypothetical protein
MFFTSSQEYSRTSIQAMHLSAKKVGPGVDQCSKVLISARKIVDG